MKDELRRKYKAIRKNVSERAEKNENIAQNLITSDLWRQAKVVALYLSFCSEVSTEDIVRQGWREKKIIAAPVTDEQSYAMDFYRIEEDSVTSRAGLGMAEPTAEADKIILPQEIDLCILPGIAFDQEGHRIGMGKGCYDRYLPKLRSETVKVALAYEAQVADESLSYEEFDVLMDYIVTEERIISCQNEKN